MHSHCLKIIIITVLSFGFSVANGQKPQTKNKIEKQSKKAKKRKQQDKDEIEELTVFLRKKHQENQSKEVKKRMKKSRKRAKRYIENRREFFVKRWFKRRRRR